MAEQNSSSYSQTWTNNFRILVVKNQSYTLHFKIKEYIMSDVS